MLFTRLMNNKSIGNIRMASFRVWFMRVTQHSITMGVHQAWLCWETLSGHQCNSRSWSVSYMIYVFTTDVDRVQQTMPAGMELHKEVLSQKVIIFRVNPQISHYWGSVKSAGLTQKIAKMHDTLAAFVRHLDSIILLSDLPRSLMKIEKCSIRENGSPGRIPA